MGQPRVKMQTNKGEMIIELNAEAAPISAENFLSYVRDDFYKQTIFHRVIPNFMIQGGGFTVDMAQKKTAAEIKNEADNGLKNVRAVSPWPEPKLWTVRPVSFLSTWSITPSSIIRIKLQTATATQFSGRLSKAWMWLMKSPA